MPLLKYDSSGPEKPPDKPHFVLRVGEMGEEGIAIPPGASLNIIEDATDSKRWFPLVLIAVNHKRIVFKCDCGRKGCNAVYTFTASRQGTHPPR